MTDLTYRTYKEFIGFVHKFGASLNNNFAVDYNIGSQRLRDALSYRNAGRSFDELKEHLHYLIEDVSIPDISLATGDYRYNNSPQFKYPYAQVFNQASITYILDASFVQRRIFDIWIDYIHQISGTYSGNLRVPYKADYTANITIAKYDRCSGGKDLPPLETSADIRDYAKENFKPYYSVTLVNAFPTNVSSIGLSNAASDITRVTVTFECDLVRRSPNYKDTSININNNKVFVP